jgi:hypothetical protein
MAEAPTPPIRLTRWLHVRSALMLAWFETMNLGRTIRVGIFFSVVSTLIGFAATRQVATLWGLASFPVGLLLVFLWFALRGMGRWGSGWRGTYAQPEWAFGSEAGAPKRLYLLRRSGFGPTPELNDAIQCVVREPSGRLVASSLRGAINGRAFPEDFPDLAPPAPGRYHAYWLLLMKRWWTLAEFDFEFPGNSAHGEPS